jgi:hypothetical protein
VDLRVHLTFKPNMMHVREVSQQIKAQLTLQMDDKHPDKPITWQVHNVQLV